MVKSMDPGEYDIVFSGVLVAGRDAAQVKAELARLFKSDAAGIERLFCGQPVIIKKGVDRTTAEKYRAVLEKVGAVCEIRTRVRTGTAVTSADRAERMSIAPPGALLTVPRTVAPLVFDLGGMSLAAAGADILEEFDAVVAAPLFDLSALSVAPPGSELGTASHPEPLPFTNVGALSVAEPGADLDTRRPAAAVALPDLSGITLAPAGAEVIRPEERKPRPAPPDITGLRFALEAAGETARQ